MKWRLPRGMGQASSTKYEVKNIKKSFLKKFSDPEVKKGIGSALIFLGIVLGVMGITFTAVAFGKSGDAPPTFPFAGPSLLFITMCFFVGGALLVRHEHLGCFKNRDVDSEDSTDTGTGTFMIFCCFCQKELTIYKERNLDETTLCENGRAGSANSNSTFSSNDSDSKYQTFDHTDTVINVGNISGSLVSFSSVRNAKVHPIISEGFPEAKPRRETDYSTGESINLTCYDNFVATKSINLQSDTVLQHSETTA